ncbi:hypothetical protein LXA43DRAFT_392443 [Ganoderma leucocontextum]|nr:hypothetical protein LXA43DRAFT_392443 [Ganoderma leucocontextum]
MSSIEAQMRGLSLDELVQAATTAAPQPRGRDAESLRRPRRARATNPVQVNPRPLPSAEECRAARKRCMYYGFYGGELAIQRMLIDCFPKQLGGRDPFEPGLLLPGVNFIRDITGRPDIGVHIAYVAQRNKDAIPSIGLEVDEVTFIVGLFPLEREAYINRITQEDVDMLAELFGTKPSWWEIAQLCNV